MRRFSFPRIKNRLLRFKLKKRPLNRFAQMNLHALDHLNIRHPANNFNYVVLAIKTTGSDLTHDRILSIGAVRIIHSRIYLDQVFNQFVDSECDLPPEANKVHSIVPDMVKNAPGGKVLIDDFLQFIGDSILVAHRATFDLHFLNRMMMAKHGFALQNLVLDTHPLYTDYLMPTIYKPSKQSSTPNIQDASEVETESNYFTLDTLTNMLGIQVYQQNTALGDALATAMIFQRILSKVEKKGEGKLEDLVKIGWI